MIDLIVFKVGENRYAMDIENVQRIIQAQSLTLVPNAHPFIDGMMSHEESVIKVLSLRKMIGHLSYVEELEAMFSRLKDAHGVWVDSLKASVDTGCEFTKARSPHTCELGKWIDNFNSYDDTVSKHLASLYDEHKILHDTGSDILDGRDDDVAKAQKRFDTEIHAILTKTMGALDTFTAELEIIANSLQKLLIYENDGKKFAIKVDSIEDIAHVEEKDIMSSENNHESTELLELDGVLDIEGTLINVIKSVSLPK